MSAASPKSPRGLLPTLQDEAEALWKLQNIFGSAIKQEQEPHSLPDLCDFTGLAAGPVLCALGRLHHAGAVKIWSQHGADLFFFSSAVWEECQKADREAGVDEAGVAL